MYIHMLGICGTGMGSLALLLKDAGHHLTGSDENVYPPMSVQLEDAGIKIFKGYKVENIKDKPDIIIVGNVISRGNPEVEAVIASGISYISMPQAVARFFLKDRHSVVVAGTHGKTTMSTLCAWLLESAGLSPSFLIGGVGKNFGVSARLKKGSLFVIEGDEYDTAFFDKGPKFLHYEPRSVILGPVEFDHADIYNDLAQLMGSFEKLVAIIRADGLLVACRDSENTMKLASRAKCRVVTYGKSPSDYCPEAVVVGLNGMQFELQCPLRIKFSVPLFGNHNLQNTVGILALLLELGVSPSLLVAGLEKFEGIKRRQEIRGVKRDITIMDDFAHHPTAVRETIVAVRMKYPKARIWAIFEPRSNTSKRNIFQKEFAGAFSGSDFVIIASLYRPEKIPATGRLDVDRLVKEIGGNAYNFKDTDEIVEFAAKNAHEGDVMLIMSNGGFDNIHEKLLQRL